MKTKKFLFVMVAVMAMAAPGVVAMAGEGSSDALWNDPSEYLAANQREASAAAVSVASWNDPSEYEAALQREARSAANEVFSSFAGSYGALRLAASEAGAAAVSASGWNDPSEYEAAMQREASTAAGSETCEVC